jgi:hypothetical protein
VRGRGSGGGAGWPQAAGVEDGDEDVVVVDEAGFVSEDDGVEEVDVVEDVELFEAGELLDEAPRLSFR